MANKLTKVDTQNLLQQERTELDGQIAAFIERNKGNAYEINRLTFDATMILTSADKHSKEKAAQKFFERFRKNITGANNGTQDDINKKLAQAQYAAQQVIVKLAEQQQLSFEVISLVHNKLNAGLLNVNKEINDIYRYLLNIDERVEKLEKNFELLTWATTIKSQKYCGTEYRDLDNVAKIVCTARDFFDIMQGKQGTINDLNLLEAAMENLKLTRLIREDFILHVGTDWQLYDYLLGEGSKLKDFMTEHEEIIFAMQKAEDREFFPQTQTEIKAYDLILELLYNLRQLTLLKEVHDKTDAAEKLFLSGKISEALPILVETASAGSTRARYMLAVMYYEGLGVEKNPDRVRELLSENIFTGDVCSIFFGVRIGLVAKEKTKLHHNEIVIRVYEGDIFAKYELSKHYDTTERQPLASKKYMRLAADRGYFLAAYELALKLYADKNFTEAKEYFEFATNAGHAYSMIYLGNIYRNGLGVSIDKEKSGLLYKRACECGASLNPQIMSNLG